MSVILKRLISLLPIFFIFNPVQAEKPVLSLVIDDLGYSFEQAKNVFELPGNHTFAVIPATTYSVKIARYAHENGHEIILHMPMQSSTDLILESSALNDSMTEDEITDGVRNMLKEIPYIKGINNHMGSRLTEIDYIMRPVMETIRQQNKSLYFLDSRTTPLSMAYQQALRAGLLTTKRDVFIDYDHNNEASMHFQFNRWLKKAQENGSAVAIAHPYQSTIDLLSEKLAEIQSDYQFQTVSELVKNPLREASQWSRYLSHLQKDSKNSKQ